MMRFKFLLGLLSLLVFLVPEAISQSMNGSLSGTVMDPGGAVIVGANVTIKNSESGRTWNSVTNHDGFFAVNTLPASTYEVTVSASGFSKYHAHGIVLNASDMRTMSIELRVGSTNETVEVHGSTTELAPINSGEKTYTISADDLQHLSLVSRDATEIVSIMPGSIMVSNAAINKAASDNQTLGLNVSGPLGNTNINGQTIDVTMDGAHTFDPGAYGNSVPVTANQDMISEVKILTSNFTADNPKGPVVVNTVSKTGGKDFHGDFRFYARNSAMNSNDAFAKQNSIAKPDSSYYYPGFGVGGPIIIPGTNFNKQRNKFFFHESFEYYKQQVDYGVERAFVMTPDMLNGDFSAVSGYGSVAGGSTFTATPATPNWASGNWGSPWIAYTQGAAAARLQNCTVSAAGVLSAGCMDTNAQALMKAYLPSPTTTTGAPVGDTGFNYVKDFTGPMNANQNMAKVEWDINETNKITTVYNRERQTADWVLGLWSNSASDNAVPAPTGVIGGDLSDFVSTTFMHVFSPSMTSETKFSFTYLDYPEKPSDATRIMRDDIPNFDLTGIWNPQTAPMVVTWGSGFPNLGAIGDAFHPTFVCYSKLPAVGEDLTRVFGKHDAKFGMYLEDIFHTQDNWSQFMGAISYYNWAPSITGNMYADTLTGVGLYGYYEQPQPPGPVTVNLKTLAFYAQDSWKLTRRLTVQYGMRFDHYGKPYQPKYGLAVFNPKHYDPNSSPDDNTGVEWHSQNSNVPLSGASSRLVFFEPRVGMAFDFFGDGSTILRGGWGMFRAYDPVQKNNYTATAQTAQGSFSWSCGFNDPLCPSLEDIDTHALPTPNWGHASLGTGLKGVTTMDPSDDEQPLVTTYSATIDQKLPAKFHAEISYVGNESTKVQTQVNTNAIPIGSLLTNPKGCDVTTTACQSSYRPYSNYEGILNSTTAGKARFDSLQASLQRNTGFLTLMLNYTYSKQLGNSVLGGSVGDGYKDWGVNEFYGVLPGNRPHVLSAAYVFSLPKLESAQSLVRQALGGWEFSGITQIESSASLTANNTGDAWNLNLSVSALGSAADNTHLLGTPDVQLQPLLTCDPRHGNSSHVFLNANCIAPPPGSGVNGTTKMPYLPGPMFWKSDLTALKGFKIGDKQSIQFRVAAFNFLNHALLSFAPSDSNLKAIFGADGKISNPNFGKAVNHYGMRILEIGAKYTF